MKRINGSDLAGKVFEELKNGDLREIKGKFIPQDGERFWFLDQFGGTDSYIWRDYPTQQQFAKHYPIFRTEEEAEEYEHYLEALDEHSFEPDWEDKNQEKWEICYERQDKEIVVSDVYSMCSAVRHFPSLDAAEAFIDKVGEDAVKRFMFDVWD